MRAPLSARQRASIRVVAAALSSTVMALSLAACAAEPRPSLPFLSRALETNFSPNPAGGAPIEGGSASGSYLVGRFAIESGDYAEAAESLDRALAADPENVDLRRQVFLLRLANGDDERALAAAASLVEIDAGADEPLMLLALDRARAGQHAAARDLLQRVSERGATGLVQPVLEAWAIFGTGQVEQALREIGGESAEQPLYLLRRYHRALMLALARRPAQAAPLLEAEAKRPGGPPLRITQSLAQVRVDQGDKAAALRIVNEAQAASPQDPQLAALRTALEKGQRLVPVKDARTGMADALVGVAEALLDQQASAQALLLARMAEFVAPEMGDARLIVGRVLLDQNNPAAAVEALASIPPESPQSWAGRLLRAGALRELGRTDEAIGLLRQMAAERPQRIDALVALGDLLRRDERYAEAEAAYGEALQRQGRATPESWRLYYARGMALERLKRWDEAEAALKRALELQPEQPLVLNYLGYSWVDQGRNLDEAKAMLHKAVELRPDDGYIVDSLGWAYYRMGEFEKATTYLERAVEIEPGDPVINDHLGDAYWRVGRVREARFQWQRALSFKPEPDVASQIQAKLERGLPEAGEKRG